MFGSDPKKPLTPPPAAKIPFSGIQPITSEELEGPKPKKTPASLTPAAPRPVAGLGFLENDIDRTFHTSLSDPSLFPQKDPLGNEVKTKDVLGTVATPSQHYARERQVVKQRILKSPGELAGYMRQRVSAINGELQTIKSAQDELKSARLAPAPVKGLSEQVQAEERALTQRAFELEDYKNNLKISAAGQAAYHLAEEAVSRGDMDLDALGLRLTEVADPDLFDQLQIAGTVPGLTRARIERMGIEAMKGYLQSLGEGPARRQAQATVAAYEDDYYERHPEVREQEVREKIGIALRRRDLQAAWGFGYDEATLKAIVEDPATGLSAEEKQHALSYTLPLEARLIGTSIPTGGATKSLYNAFAKTMTGTGNSLASLTGLRSEGDQAQDLLEDPLVGSGLRPAGENPEYVGERSALEAKKKARGELSLEEQLRLDHLETLTHTRSRVEKFGDMTFDLTGQVAGIITLSETIGGVGHLLKAGGISSALGVMSGTVGQALTNQVVRTTLSGYLNSLDLHQQQAIQLFPHDQDARDRYAHTMAVAEGLVENIFQDAKLVRGLVRGAAPTVADITRRLISGEMTREMAQAELKKGLKQTLKIYAREMNDAGIKEGLEEGIMEPVDALAQALYGDRPVDVDAVAQRTVKTFGHTYFSMGVVGLAAGRRAHVRANAEQAFFRASLIDAVRNPAPYLQAVEALELSGEITAEQAEEKRRILNNARRFTEELPEGQFMVTEGSAYVLHRLNEAELTRQMAATTDPVLKNQLEEELKRSQAVREGMMQGTVTVDADGNPAAQDQGLATETGIGTVGGARYTSENIGELDLTGRPPVQQRALRFATGVLQALSKITPGVTLVVHDTQASYEKAVLEAEGDNAMAHTSGFWMSDSGEIHLNAKRMVSNTLLHEGFHPVLNYVAAKKPAILGELVKELKGLQEQLPYDYMAYGAESAPDDKVQAQKEAITEFMADVADGRILINASNFEKLRQFFVNLLSKLGLVEPGAALVELDSASGLRALAQAYTESVKNERAIDLTEVVGEDIEADVAAEVEQGVEFQVLKNTKPSKVRTEIARLNREDPEAVPLEVVGEPAVMDNGRDVDVQVQQVPYELLNGALKHVSKNEDRAAEKIAERIAEDYRLHKNDKAIAAGIGWYSNMRAWFVKHFGANIELFGQVLAATSARTPVKDNFAQTVDALRNLSRGTYDELLGRYDAHVKAAEALSEEELRAIAKVPEGKKFNPEEVRRKVINQFAEEPLRSNGKKFNANGKKVLQALYGNWLRQTEGPKTKNFAGNLTGRSLEATIDVWAARYMRRVIYSPHVKRWRIRPSQEGAVQHTTRVDGSLGGDYPFAEKVMRIAAQKIGIHADDLQAFLWYLEKDVWDKAGWTGETGKAKVSFEEGAQALKTTRYQAGLTTYKDDASYDSGKQAALRDAVNAALNRMPGVVVSRVTLSDGEYKFEGTRYQEPSLDVEFVVDEGTNVAAVWEQIKALTQDQHSVIFSEVVEPTHPNARPMLEIGLKHPAEESPVIEEVKQALYALGEQEGEDGQKSSGPGGFTTARDRQGRILGIRSQYVPEFTGDATDEARAKGAAAWISGVKSILDKFDNHPDLSYLTTGFVNTQVHFNDVSNTQPDGTSGDGRSDVRQAPPAGTEEKADPGAGKSKAKEGKGEFQNTATKRKLKENKSKATQDFFSTVVKGADDKFKAKKDWQPLLPVDTDHQRYADSYAKFKGHFDQHIATSIPGFRDVQIRKGAAIVSMLPKGGLVIDIGGSEGGFVKAITEASGGKIRTVNVDVNDDMQAVHEATPVEGSTFVKEAFYEEYIDEEAGINAPAHVPAEKADVVHESMVFQFITPERAQFVEEVKNEYLKPGGVFITEEKLLPETEEEFRANERKKDTEFKSQYYTVEELKKKDEEVLVGMKKNQTPEAQYVRDLADHFQFVFRYWDSGNFKGLVASDSKEAIDKFMAGLGSTETAFSTRRQGEPLVVDGEVQQRANPRLRSEFQRPTIKKVIKQNTDSRVTDTVVLKELAALKKQIKDRYRGIAQGHKEGWAEGRDALRGDQKVIEELREEVRTYIDRILKEAADRGVLKGEVAGRVFASAVRHLSRAKTPYALLRFFDKLDRILQDVDYDNKLKAANSLRKKIKRALRSKGREHAANNVATIKGFLQVNPGQLEDLEEYTLVAQQILHNLQGLKVTLTEEGGRASGKSYGISNADIEDFTAEMITEMEAAHRTRLAKRHAELVEMGLIDPRTMSADEMQAAIDQLAADPASEETEAFLREAATEEKLRTARTVLAQAQDDLRDYYVESDEEQSSFSPEERKTLRGLLKVDPARLSMRELVKAVDAINNVLTNGSFVGAGMSALQGVVDENLTKLEERFRQLGVKLHELESLFVKGLASVPLMMEYMTKGSKAAAELQRLTGIADVFNGHARAKKRSGEVIQAYMKLKRGMDKAIDSPLNRYRRGVIARVVQNFGGTPEEQQAEFARVKDHVRQSAERLQASKKKGNKEKGQLVQQVYDELLEGASEIQDVLNRMTGINHQNMQLVRFWIDTFAAIKEPLRESAEIYNNRLFDEIDNYTPVSLATVSGEAFDSDEVDIFAATFGAKKVDNRPATTKIKRTSSKNLRRDGVLNLDFDVVMGRKYYESVYDIEAGEALNRVRIFFDSPRSTEILGEQNRKTVLDRIRFSVDMQRNRRLMRDELSELVSRSLNRLQMKGVRIALGSLDQAIKQYPTVALNTVINLGADAGLFFKALMLPNNLPWLERFNIVERGSTRAGYNRDIDFEGMKPADFGNDAERALHWAQHASEKVSEAIMWTLVKSDVAVARTSWLAYYMQDLARRGFTESLQDLKNPGYVPNEEAAAWAEQMVARTQNANDPTSMPRWVQQGGTDGVIKNIALPFSSFALNGRMRITSDVQKLVHGENKAEAARSLTGTLVEQTLFNALKVYVTGGLSSLVFKAIAGGLGVWGEKDEEDEENKKRVAITGPTGRTVETTTKAKKVLANTLSDLLFSGTGTFNQELGQHVLNYAYSRTHTETFPDLAGKDGFPVARQNPTLYWTYDPELDERWYNFRQWGTYGIALQKLADLTDPNTLERTFLGEEDFVVKGGPNSRMVTEKTPLTEAQQNAYLLAWGVDLAAFLGLSDAQLSAANQKLRQHLDKQVRRDFGTSTELWIPGKGAQNRALHGLPPKDQAPPPATDRGGRRKL